MDIHATKEVVGFMLSLGEGVAALGDGQGTLLSDALTFLEAAKRAPAAFRDRTLVLPELQDLDDAEKADLKAFITKDFDIADDNLETIIESVLVTAVDFAELLKLLPTRKVVS
jgi:hypothetical protein